jgi:ribosome-binding ATPase
MMLGIVGKTNVGKSTFFSASTLVDAEISNRIFTTIKPNKGVTYVTAECPCKGKQKCSPRNSKCIDGVRFVPVKVIDVAGLVPDAHKGRGLGNQFLSDIMEANALIHVVDISGSTDSEGHPVSVGSNDPRNDIEFLKKEIDYWILGIISKLNIKQRSDIRDENLAEVISKQITGLGIKLEHIERAVIDTGLTTKATEDDFLKFIEILREKSKPFVIAGNKIDIPGADKVYDGIKETEKIFPCSAEAELALRRASEKGMIKYLPGSGDFEIIGEVDDKHKAALEFLRNNILKKYGSTGVQKIIDETVFNLLDMIIVYPVENEHKWSDKKGNVLPDAFLMKKGSTAHDLAYQVHEDIGKKFIGAIDARTGRNVSADYELKNNDIISIRAGK